MKRIFVMGKQVMLAAVLFAGLSVASCYDDMSVPEYDKPVVEEPNPENPTPDNGGNNQNQGDNGNQNQGNNNQNQGNNNQNQGPVDLAPEMFMAWADGVGSATDCAFVLGEATECPYGTPDPAFGKHADLSGYKKLILVVTDGAPRCFFNDGDPDRITVNADSPYWSQDGETITIDLETLAKEHDGKAHLTGIKGASYGTTVTVTSMKLEGGSGNGGNNNQGGNQNQGSDQPQGPVDLTKEGFSKWSDWVNGENQGAADCFYVIGESTSQPYGDGSVNNYIDLTGYTSLEITVTEGAPRTLLNRDETEGQAPDHLIAIPNNADQTAAYQTSKDNGDGSTTYIIDLAKIKEDKGYVHLHAIKGANNANVTVTSMKLTGGAATPAPAPSEPEKPADNPSTDAPTFTSNGWKDGKFVFEGTGFDKVTKGMIKDYSIALNKDASDGFSVSADGKVLTLATPVAGTFTFQFFVGDDVVFEDKVTIPEN